MKSNRSWHIGLLLLFAFLSNACDSGNGLTAGGGIGGTGIISSGAIAGFGSILVNGTKFDTRHATIIVNGEAVGVGDSAARANLAVGQVVTVEGPGSETANGVVAGRVIYHQNVQGPIDQVHTIDRATKQIVVLGQTVIVNALTEFKGTSFGAISPNDVVEVSGFQDNTGAIRATFLQRIGAFALDLTHAVNGYVTNLNADLAIFRINNLTVDYSQADTSTLPAGVPVDGLRVEVEGRLDVAGDVLVAETVAPGDELAVDTADQIEITGFVTAVSSLLEFTLGDQIVIIEKGAAIVDGELADISPGVKLEAEGALEGGILFAYEIEFWQPDQIAIGGTITDVISASKFTVGDQAVSIQAETVFENGTRDDIDPGINVEIKGRMRDGVLVADRVSFEASDEKVK